MEEHLIVTSNEHKVLKKFRTRLQNLLDVEIYMPEESSESDVIFVSVVGDESKIVYIKEFISAKMNALNTKTESQKNVILITLSDSEDSVSSDSNSKENSVCVLEELACANNYPNLVKNSSTCEPLDDSVCIIDCPKNSPVPNVKDVKKIIRRKRKLSKRQKLRNKKIRIKDILRTDDDEVLEISSTTDACEVSSTTQETLKKAQPKGNNPTCYIPLVPPKDQTKSSLVKCGTEKEKNNAIFVKEPSLAPRRLRPIVIDGSNVAIDHGRVSHCFSSQGIKIAVEYFLKRGHTDVHAFVPKFRRISNPNHNFPTKDPEILDELANRQLVVFTPSRRVNGKCIASYDDRFIVELASRNGGVIVSNDNYRDLIGESDAFKETIEKRLLMFCFVGDIIMIPSDPLGRNGPSLENFLSFPSES